MMKDAQQRIYAAVGKELTKARQHQNMSISRLANAAGEQYMTIKNIEEGGGFMFHHTSWMRDVLGMDINKLVIKATNEGIHEREEKKREQEEHDRQILKEGEGLEGFI